MTILLPRSSPSGVLIALAAANARHRLHSLLGPGAGLAGARRVRSVSHGQPDAGRHSDRLRGGRRWAGGAGGRSEQSEQPGTAVLPLGGGAVRGGDRADTNCADAACLLIGMGCALTQRLLFARRARSLQNAAPRRSAGSSRPVYAASCSRALADRLPRTAWLAGCPRPTPAGGGPGWRHGRCGAAYHGPKRPGRVRCRRRLALARRGDAAPGRAAASSRVRRLQLGLGDLPARVRMGADPGRAWPWARGALLGAAAALISGRFCARVEHGRVARAGFAGVVAASIAVALGLRCRLVLSRDGAAGCRDAGLVGRQPGPGSGARIHAGDARPPGRHRDHGRLRRRGGGSALGNLLISGV